MRSCGPLRRRRYKLRLGNGPGLEGRSSLLRLQLVSSDLLGPMAGDELPVERAERRHLGAAPLRLHVGAARVEAAAGGRIGRARQIALKQDCLALTLDHGVWNRDRRE